MEKTARIQELKKLLSKELQKKVSDSNTVLSLSNEIAMLDDDQVRFSVDAGIINRLGKELVAKQETAVSELVKNAYDADATEVELYFENADTPGGTLHVIDNGLGMTRDQLVNGFMRLSSSDKIHNPVSPRYKRVRAGKKGIGRFATQRLGSRLTIVTQTKGIKSALKVIIDWNNFSTDINLSAVTSRIETLPKNRVEGTELIIEDLRDNWTDDMIRKVFRFTADLLQPFPLSEQKKKEKKEKEKIDPGFKSSYYRRNKKENIHLIVDEQTGFLEHALAEITGHVAADGAAMWSLKSDKLNFPKTTFRLTDIGKRKDKRKAKEKGDGKYRHIKDIHFKTHYFIYERNLLPPNMQTFIKEVAEEKGGIRVYRNGFRVLPYGEKLNDWLGLDESSAKRVILTPHRNNAFFGYVELTDETGVLFDETSSREGLIENEAFRELVDFVFRSIISATVKISELRKRKGSTSQKGWKEEENPQVNAAIEGLETIVNEGDTGDTNTVRDAVNRIKEEVQKEQERNRDKELALIEEINMLRVLGGLGLVIGEFVHEVKRFLPAFQTDIRYLKNKVKDDDSATGRALRLEENIKAFTAYTAYFDKTVSQNILRELQPIELRDIVYEFESVIQKDLERSKLIFHKPAFKGFDLFTTPMHRSEWASILFNFYTNAKKAVRRAGTKGELFIKCGRNNGNVFLEFSDNGDGIPEENKQLIFDAFFTTSSAPDHMADDTEILTGSGLGLKIVRDIAESYGGKVYVAQPEKGFNTTIRIEIPENLNA